MELKSDTYRVTLDEKSGEFQVWQLANKGVQVIQNGVEVAPDEATKRLVDYMNSTPTFAANWAGDGFNVDIEAGMRRWHGTKSETDVRRALKVCGFDTVKIRTIFQLSKIQQHDWIRRY